MAYIKVIQQNEATGALKEVYDDLVQSRGKLAEVHKIQSLHPKSIPAHMNLYLEVMFASSPLKRYQREMMAVVVSVHNGCHYCQRHHLEALNHFWKNDKKVRQLQQDFTTAGLSALDAALCRYAAQLTAHPDKNHECAVLDLKKLGLDDRGILDAALVIGYFNFVNRMVMGLGVELEMAPGGYNYESFSG